MILVTVGTNGAPFDRLLRLVDALDTAEPLVVQRGSSRLAPRRASCIDFAPFPELAELVASARAVVSHAGVGSVLLALHAGHRPILVPRLRRFREAVDDHQLELALRLHDEGLAHVAQTEAELRDAVEIARRPNGRESPFAASPALAEELRLRLVEACGTGRRRERDSTRLKVRETLLR
ncbi:MAG TPA: glycosyltransferase [Gaiellaceae bacterium]|nr:glycosyltransferase [Gaiellaceae bacterium]